MYIHVNHVKIVCKLFVTGCRVVLLGYCRLAVTEIIELADTV